MSKLNESWDGAVEGFREDNPFVRPLMNLDDVRKSLDSMTISTEAYNYFEQLWDKLIEEGHAWETEHPVEEDPEMTSKKPRMVSISSFVSMLRSDIVLFQFEKKDGSIRTAYGTRNHKIIADVIGAGEGEGSPKRPPRPGFVTYFDMEKEQFRCFAEERFLGVIDEHAGTGHAPVSEKALIEFSLFTEINESLNSYFEDEEE